LNQGENADRFTEFISRGQILYSNNHSIHLLEFLSEGPSQPTFSFNPPDPSMSDPSDMISKQVSGSNELDWMGLQKEWITFPFSLGKVLCAVV
jgi:hypothetical protein